MSVLLWISLGWFISGIVFIIICLLVKNEYYYTSFLWKLVTALLAPIFLIKMFINAIDIRVLDASLAAKEVETLKELAWQYGKVSFHSDHDASLILRLLVYYKLTVDIDDEEGFYKIMLDLQEKGFVQEIQNREFKIIENFKIED